MSDVNGRENGGFSASVMADLKDFQRDMVDYVFDRLYADEDPARRFLVASETGLGKTLVARGVIARAIDHLRGKVDRVDVLYICSNAEIARQNISRLNVTGQGDFALASRITLLPTVVHELEKNDLNFISFTPGTSFDLGSTMGRIEERALLYHLLRDSWNLGGRKAPLNVLQGGVGTEKFRARAESFAHDYSIDEKLKGNFANALHLRTESQRNSETPDIRARFDGLCKRFSRSNRRLAPSDKRERIRFIGELRGILATACIEALEPDLIILDEFQRFKNLLDGTDAASELAKGLFEWGNARTLLLSATPYKMYTLGHEEDDDHYADFLRTLEFLEYGSEQKTPPRVALADYRRALFRIGEDGVEEADRAKGRLEDRLRRTMSRTEKLAATSDRNGMLVEIPSGSVRLEARDLQGYVATRRVLDATGFGDAMEYWKSSPYLFNFMDGYSLKNGIGEALESGNENVVRALADGREHALSRSDVLAYGKIDPSNARLRSLISDTVDAGMWKMLWLAPSMPYHRLGGPFSGLEASRATKRLVFSSWRVVPKVIAAMVSYEAERRMMIASSPKARNTREARKRRRGLLRFTIDRTPEYGDRPTGMSALGILYPSETLARECDLLRLESRSAEILPSLEQTLDRLRDRAGKLLEPVVIEHAAPSDAPDEAWYWAAPILLDLFYRPEPTRAWFSQEDLTGTWSDGGDDQDDSSGFARHVEQARLLLSRELRLGTPPEDLYDVLALESLAAPGVTALRALERVAPGAESNILRNCAARVSWHLRTLFNLPESVSLIRSLSGKGVPYWQAVLAYSANGCLQSVLDEYAHVLKDFRGTPDETARGVTLEMCRALGIKASSISVDHFEADEGNLEVERVRGNMRGRFALRFGDEKSDDGSEATRSSQVREAFNSPFWPFVLATTSVGQEGLDFHTYCHAVVHWNLPSNPVDLEQREGRVHRYKNHAVRKNVAAAGDLTTVTGADHDPWDSLFEIAARERDEDATDMVPYWIFPLQNGENGAKIERHVPALPLSRDRARMEVLRKSLAAYRMVFGQARQEDLLAYLLSRFTEEEVSTYANTLRIDLQPPRNSTARR